MSGVCGIIVESDILNGAHKEFPTNPSLRTYGLSVTDPCSGIPESEDLLEALASKFR
jgi:phospho-2-dehydro-3-deoxyheptonate aldolase